MSMLDETVTEGQPCLSGEFENVLQETRYSVTFVNLTPDSADVDLIKRFYT